MTDQERAGFIGCDVPGHPQNYAHHCEGVCSCGESRPHLHGDFVRRDGSHSDTYVLDVAATPESAPIGPENANP